MPEILGTDARDSGKLQICRVTVKAKQAPQWWELGAPGPPLLCGKRLYLPTSVNVAVNCCGVTRGSAYLQLPEIVNPDRGVTFSEVWRGEAGAALGQPAPSQGVLCQAGSATGWDREDSQDTHVRAVSGLLPPWASDIELGREVCEVEQQCCILWAPGAGVSLRCKCVEKGFKSFAVELFNGKHFCCKGTKAGQGAQLPKRSFCKVLRNSWSYAELSGSGHRPGSQLSQKS